MKAFDVYAYGVIAPSTLHLLSQPFPPPDGYAEIARSVAMTGGEALNSGIVLSRLGVSVFLDGAWIGDNPEGMQLLERIRGFGIDASRLRVKKGYAGIKEIVFSDDKTRSIFGSYAALLSGPRRWNIPRKSDIARARLVCVDPPFREESELAARYAVQLGIPFVSIDCPYDQILTAQAEAVVVSGEARGNLYPGADLTELFAEYQGRAKGLAVFTVGSETILYARKGEAVRQIKPFKVEVIDSAGAGDSFRAGVAYGLLRGWSDEETIRYAAGVAALVCASFPGVLNSPTHEQVLRLIEGKK